MHRRPRVADATGPPRADETHFFPIPASASAAGGACAAPTSSGATNAQLRALQQNATGDEVRINAIGMQGDIYQAFASVASGVGVTSSQSSYALLEQPLVLGRNQVTEASTTYAYSSTPDVLHLKYAAGIDTLTLGQATVNDGAFTVQRSNTYDKSIGSGGSGGHIGVKDWHAMVGMLTDRTDAPADADVQYAGSVTIRAGDGSPVIRNGVGQAGHITFGGCAITLKLHTATGALTTTDASCTDAQTGAVIRFTLAPLNFSGSRLAGQLGTEANVQIAGPRGGLIGPPAAEPTSALFSSSSLAGAVYGKAAASIVVVGASAQGIFRIVAQRL